MPTAPTTLPVFDPEAGRIVRRPEVRAPGYWAGCPSVLVDENGDVLLTYRRRRPRGVIPDRGHTCLIARSADGMQFTDVLAIEKGQLGSPSMERFDIVMSAYGQYLLYLSYVDPADLRWRVDVVEAPRPESFDVSRRRPLLTAAATGTEGVKDPFVVDVGHERWMFVSYAEAGLTREARDQAHASADIYNTGMTTFPTGLATSADGLAFQWMGQALSVGRTWDRYQARLTAILPGRGSYLAYYDGSASVDENYEERCGIAASDDLRHWRSLTEAGPAVVAGNGTRSVRYCDAVVVDDDLWVYYEYTCPDGSHELRTVRLPHWQGTGRR